MALLRNDKRDYDLQKSGLKTIAAIATPQGKGGIGVIRISGSKALAIALKLTGKPHFTPRQVSFCRFYDSDNDAIDEGLVLYFKAPHSFTGEEVIELHGHGGVVLQNQLLARVLELGATPAQAGEFSFRAFDNDKLDLVQLEAIADAIDAGSAAAAKSAMRSLAGEFSRHIQTATERMIQLRLYVEASIDFPDEEGVDFLSDGKIANKLNEVLNKLEAILKDAEQGLLLRDGVDVVLAGKPNVGKSSLLNRLANNDRAIVTDVAGTTRDTLQETLVLDGLTVHLTDTAGLRTTKDAIEQIGIQRAKQAISKADLIIVLYDMAKQLVLNDEDKQNILAELLPEFDLKTNYKKVLFVGNKLDLLDQTQKDALSMQVQDDTNLPVFVSCETGEGLSEFISMLCSKVGFHPPENSLIARTRHIDALKRSLSHLHEASIQLEQHHAGELVAESLRLAHDTLGEITGVVSSDELLGKIFSSFCIGK